MTQQIEFKISSDLNQVSLVSISISAIAKQIALDEMTCYQVETCVVEAINNAIIHAYQKQAGNDVIIECHISSEQLQIFVCDYGQRMESPIPDASLAVDPQQEGGRGWFIMQQWMDKVDYMSANGMNKVCLIKNY